MVYGIVKQSDGSFWLYSELGNERPLRFLSRAEDEAEYSLHEREQSSFRRGARQSSSSRAAGRCGSLGDPFSNGRAAGR